ncbi:MAG: sensor domain-containing diguanylate cyclase [Terracidiphilus sp.]|jgi:diguanylate cyclase (GGDEF)-like protein/PAS domain S-box-containing protein
MRASAASITSRHPYPWLRRPAISLLLAICLLVAGLAAFLQAQVPLVLLLYPLLAMLMVRRGGRWAAIATLIVALIGSWCAWHGQTPFTQARPLPWINLSIFLGSAALLLLIVSVVLERERELVRQLEKVAALHALVSENSRDAIILADLSGHRSYVSSAAESLGWKPEDLLTQGANEMVHPEDQQRAQAIVNELNSGREGAMIECRVQKPGGVFIWVEASLRLVRDPETGLPSGILNVVRDVTERKEAEKKLQEAYNAVEALAITDALTGLANRRHFDQYLAIEWRRSQRDRQPLSLLMLDADKFKTYNDTYGHQRGDNCLKQIAEACMDVVSRPGDLVARFGGEEFVVVLPNTGNDGAMQVANEICEALRGRRLPHSGNQAGIVTISAGCATLIPRFGIHSTDLIEMADKALYRAKFNGRNQACDGSMIESSGDAAQDSTLLEAAIGKPA